MLVKFPKISRNSIRFKLVIGILVIMLPLIFVLVFNNFYAISVVHNQVAESYNNTIALYMKQVDNNLGDVDRYLSNIAALNYNLQIMNFSTDQSDYTLAKMRLWTKIFDEVAIYEVVSSMFVYVESRNDFLEIANMGTYSGKQQEVVDYIISTCDETANYSKTHNEKWYVDKIDQDYYLFRILKMNDCYIGAWINIKNLIIPLNTINRGQKDRLIFVTDDGQAMMNQIVIESNNIKLNIDLDKYYISGGKDKYLIVGEKSERGNFGLMALIPEKEMLENLPYLSKAITFISIGLIALLPLCLIFIRNVVLVPLMRMMATMKRIQQGNLEVRIEPYRTSEEFQIVNETFNNMMTQINDLKINVYEEKINRQKVELQHLQLQLKPHFFMNALNIIHILAKSKNFELIQEMSQCLIQYLRFIFKSNLSFVPMNDELKHVKNYIRIQELRLDKKLSCAFYVPEFLLDLPIPPLIIHTFVENAIKYAITLDNSTTLSIRAEFVDMGELEPYLKIIISDTGKGFSPEVLSELRKGHRIVNQEGEHIGIWNVVQRLMLLYEGRANIHFKNGESGGAIVEIVLPITESKLNSEASYG